MLSEELKTEIAQWDAEKVILETMHHTRAPINTCLGYLELFKVLKTAERLNQEEVQIIEFLSKHLNNIKLSHAIMSYWLSDNKTQK
jgi:hypothetical protein